MGSAGAEQKDDLCRSSDRCNKQSKKEVLVATFLLLTSKSPYKEAGASMPDRAADGQPLDGPIDPEPRLRRHGRRQRRIAPLDASDRENAYHRQTQSHAPP
jgi:hypothetical protein